MSTSYSWRGGKLSSETVYREKEEVCTIMTKRNHEDLDFAVPGQEGTADRVKTAEFSSAVERRLSEGKKLTFFWLIQHYSSANAAAYRREKERKKAMKAHLVTNPPKETLEQPVAHQYGCQVEDARQVAYDSASKIAACAQGSEENFGRTVFIDHSRARSAEYRPQANLECLGFEKTVAISRVPFRIGRSLEDVDLCIADNDAVGRRHAEITFHDGAYWIVDLRSLNHVYIDGAEIPAQREVQLRDGVRIVLGNEEFVFHVDLK